MMHHIKYKFSANNKIKNAPNKHSQPLKNLYLLLLLIGIPVKQRKACAISNQKNNIPNHLPTIAYKYPQNPSSTPITHHKESY